jgi:hypothetical protein
MQKSAQVEVGELIAQGVGISCVAAVLLAFFPGWAMVGTIFSRADAPAWVQAIGSIAAILVAVGVAYWQGRSSLNKEARDERQKITNEKSIAAYQLNTFCGALFAVREKIIPGRPISLWDLRLMYVLFKTELANVQGLPVLALNLDSRRALFGFRLIAIQFIEALSFGEQALVQNANKEMIVRPDVAASIHRLIEQMQPNLVEMKAILLADKL